MNSSDDDSPEAQAAASGQGKSMGFWDHIDELRGTIIKSVAVFALFVGLIAYNLKDFHDLLLQPFNQIAAKYPHLDVHLGTTTMMEGFNAVFQVCTVGGLMLAAPFILFFVAQFVAPALTARESKVVLPLCVAAVALFLLGAAFGFFLLLPAAVDGLIWLNAYLNIESRPSIGSYYSLLTRSIVGVGGAFEFPLVIVLLSWLGLVSSSFLRKHRRHAVLGVFVVSAVVTPSTDPFVQCMMALPLYVLFELGIAIAARMEKRRERSGAAVIVALLALWPRTKTTAKASLAEARLA